MNVCAQRLHLTCRYGSGVVSPGRSNKGEDLCYFGRRQLFRERRHLFALGPIFGFRATAPLDQQSDQGGRIRGEYRRVPRKFGILVRYAGAVRLMTLRAVGHEDAGTRARNLSRVHRCGRQGGRP